METQEASGQPASTMAHPQRAPDLTTRTTCPPFCIKFPVLCSEFTKFIHLITSTWVPSSSMWRNWRNYFQIQNSRAFSLPPPQVAAQESLTIGLQSIATVLGTRGRGHHGALQHSRPVAQTGIPRACVITSPPLPCPCKSFWWPWSKHSTLRFILKINSYLDAPPETELCSALLFPKTLFLDRL